MLVFVNKIESLNNQQTVKSSYFTSIGGILLNYFSGILFKYYLQDMSKELLSKAKKQADIDEYTANIARMDTRIDSLKNASPDNLNGYDKRSANDVLAVIVRCKYSVEAKGRSVAETFDFYLSPDGSKCYAKTKAK